LTKHKFLVLRIIK